MHDKQSRENDDPLTNSLKYHIILFSSVTKLLEVVHGHFIGSKSVVKSFVRDSTCIRVKYHYKITFILNIILNSRPDQRYCG